MVNEQGGDSSQLLVYEQRQDTLLPWSAHRSENTDFEEYA